MDLYSERSSLIKSCNENVWLIVTKMIQEVAADILGFSWIGKHVRELHAAHIEKGYELKRRQSMAVLLARHRRRPPEAHT